MKTITTAAFLLALTALATSARADEPKDQGQAAADEPIVLSEAEMDGVTAGRIADGYYLMLKPLETKITTGANNFSVTLHSSGDMD